MTTILNKERIASIDILRGLVMVIMALDHTREFFTNLSFYPSNLEHTTAVLFFTRFITNFCAPIFIMLVGTGMSIAVSRGKSIHETATFLLTRGLWLLVTEFTLIHFAWTFNFNLTAQDCQVIWAIGWSMIVLAGLIYFPKWFIFLFGITLVVGSDLLDGKEHVILGSWYWLHSTASITLNWPTTILLKLDYPLIPWIGVPALGYVMGSVFSLNQKQRAKILYLLGFACVALFIILRFINHYGDPHPWTTQKNDLFTFMSFLSPSKYPPSLEFLLMTLGPAFILLPVLELAQNNIARILSIFGKVPFFFYFLHIVLIHGLAVILAYARFGQATHYFSNYLLQFDPKYIMAYGYSLPVIYLIWMAVIVMLFPMCKWFAKVKRENKNNVWLSYI